MYPRISFKKIETKFFLKKKTGLLVFYLKVINEIFKKCKGKRIQTVQSSFLRSKFFSFLCLQQSVICDNYWSNFSTFSDSNRAKFSSALNSNMTERIKNKASLLTQEACAFRKNDSLRVQYGSLTL